MHYQLHHQGWWFTSDCVKYRVQQCVSSFFSLGASTCVRLEFDPVDPSQCACLGTYMRMLTWVNVSLSLSLMLEFFCGQAFLTLYFLLLGFVLLFLLLAGHLRNPAESVHFASSWPLLSLSALLFFFFFYCFLRALFFIHFVFGPDYVVWALAICRKTRTKK